MRAEDDQPLWDLLGKSPEASASPFFARNVVREIRRQSTGWQRFSVAFHLKWLAPVTAVAITLLATPYFMRSTGGENQADAVAKLNAEDYEVVAELDDLVSVDENTLWTDNTSL